jgi:hypothetical protein
METPPAGDSKMEYYIKITHAVGREAAQESRICAFFTVFPPKNHNILWMYIFHNFTLTLQNRVIVKITKVPTPNGGITIEKDVCH